MNEIASACCRITPRLCKCMRVLCVTPREKLGVTSKFFADVCSRARTSMSYPQRPESFAGNRCRFATNRNEMGRPDAARLRPRALRTYA